MVENKQGCLTGKEIALCYVIPGLILMPIAFLWLAESEGWVPPGSLMTGIKTEGALLLAYLVKKSAFPFANGLVRFVELLAECSREDTEQRYRNKRRFRNDPTDELGITDKWAMSRGYNRIREEDLFVQEMAERAGRPEKPGRRSDRQFTLGGNETTFNSGGSGMSTTHEKAARRAGLQQTGYTGKQAKKYSLPWE